MCLPSQRTAVHRPCTQLDTCHVQRPCLLERERKLHLSKGSTNKQRGKEGKNAKEERLMR